MTVLRCQTCGMGFHTAASAHDDVVALAEFPCDHCGGAVHAVQIPLGELRLAPEHNGHGGPPPEAA